MFSVARIAGSKHHAIERWEIVTPHNSPGRSRPSWPTLVSAALVGEDCGVTDEDSWTDLDQAQFIFEALAKDHPSRVVTAFNDLFHTEDPFVEILKLFVTPESESDWGDFSDGSRFFRDQDIAISTRALRHKGALDVAYVKLVPDDGVYLTEVPRQDALAYVTLIWRPDLGGWRIHRIGMPAAPRDLPRTDHGSNSPSYDTDQVVELAD